MRGSQTHSCSRAAGRDYQEAGVWTHSEHIPFQGWEHQAGFGKLFVLGNGRSRSSCCVPGAILHVPKA